MGWIKKSNVAQYGGASWDNFVLKVPNCTPEKARRIAFMKPEVTFYFFCREYMVLTGHVEKNHGAFQPGDAVFFTGKPWYGSAPQCDTYVKSGIVQIYINPSETLDKFKGISSKKQPDGSVAVDVVCIFAGNYCTNEIPMLRANNNQPPTEEPLDKNILDLLQSDDVKALQDRGVVVLLTVLNGWSEVGWSSFNPKDEDTAKNFAEYLKTDVVEKYGLDGIDIDDEFAGVNAPRYNQSLAMVTTVMKQVMPSKLITKALWANHDSQYFEAEWKDHKLAENLDYGWEMSYYLGGEVKYRLQRYVGFGMDKKALCLGFTAAHSNATFVHSTMEKVMSDGYGGGMLFDYQKDPSLVEVISRTQLNHAKEHKYADYAK